jgi:hypothetical protein
LGEVELAETVIYHKSPSFKAKKILSAAFRGRLVPVMSGTPPVATAGTSGANSTIITNQNTWGAQIVSSDSRLVYYSGLVGPDGYFGWINSAWAPASYGVTMRFSTDAEAFEIRLIDVVGSAFRIMVDGEWAQANDYRIETGAGNQFIFYKIDFGVGSSRPRVIDVSYPSNVYQMLGLNVGLSAGSTSENNPYRIWKAPLPDEPKALVWGDSWATGVGIGDTNCRAGYVHKAGEYLGIKSIVGSGVGGQGYLAADGSGNSRNFRARLLASTPSDIEKFGELDLIIIGPTGVNDQGQGFTAQQLLAEVPLFAKEIIDRQPNALIAVFGPQRTPAINVTQEIHDAIKTGWQSAQGWDNGRMKFFDTIGGPSNWFDASTTVGNMTDAIYNTIVPGDEVHVNKSGHIYTGRRIADAIIDWLNTLT